MKVKFKVFGASFDPSDSITKIAIKRKYIEDLAFKRPSKHNLYLDAYEAFIKESKILDNPIFEKVGKFPVESWLRAKPDVEDAIFLDPLEFRTFLDTNGCKEYMELMTKFIEDKIFPDYPLMIGADHSLTGGVLKALAKKYGPQNISIIILDGHFDAIPTDLRLGLANYSKEHKDEIQIVFPEMIDSIVDGPEIPNTYNCGTFLKYLVDNKIIYPENMIVYGCLDYPDENYRKIEDDNVKKYVDLYLSFEKKGSKFIPYSKNYDQMNQKFKDTINEIETPYLYISIDVDVGALNSILAARFMDFIGVDEKCLIDISKIINNFLLSSETKLIGMDIMEIEIFFINAELKSGKKDKTISIMDNFLQLILESYKQL